MIQNDREVGWHNSGAEAGNRKGFFHDTRFTTKHAFSAILFRAGMFSFGY